MNIPAKNAIIEWMVVDRFATRIKVIDKTDQHKHYRVGSYTWGAVNCDWNGSLEQIQSFAWELVLLYGADPEEVHIAFRDIAEYEEEWTSPVFKKFPETIWMRRDK